MDGWIGSLLGIFAKENLAPKRAFMVKTEI